MNIPQEDLDRLRGLTAGLKATLSQAMRAYGREQTTQIEAALGLTAQMETRLEQAGAQRPASVAAPRDIPLRLLDTAANRRYAVKLRQAWEAGLEVDRERYGDRIGTDGCAQVIEMVLADVEQEITGPSVALRE